MAIRRPPKAPPLSVSRYELSGKVGTGSVGLVYRGRDVDTDALVAVQLISPDISDEPGAMDRLREEFRGAQQFEHPNILRLLDFGQDAGFWFLVTEWVEGITLAHMIEAHARLPEETAVRIVTQIGQAIDYAHSASYSHCRVRPANILIRNDGVAKLIAFEPAVGCIAARGHGESIPKTDIPAGKQSLSKNLPYSEAIRSLGATLHEAITGQVWVEPPPPAPPPPGRRIRSRSSRPRPRHPALSERADLAIRWATDPDPMKQPVSCAEWLKLLRSKSRTAATQKSDVRPAGEDTDDRRAYVRYAVGVGTSCMIHTSLFDSDHHIEPDTTAVWPLVVKDVSAGGIGILLARRCEPGTELSIELVTESTNTTRSLPVKVVRVRRDTLGHWIHGCEFSKPLEEKELVAVLEHLGRVDPS